MMKAVNCLAAIGCLLVAGCATTLTATTDYDPGVDFTTYSSFSWIDPNPLIRSVTQRPLSPLVVQRLMADTRDLLEGRGLRFVEDPTEADLAVAFTVGSRDGIRISSYPTTSLHRGRRGRPTNSWGNYWGGSTVRTRQYTEGQLAVDLFDVAQARPVWHGTVSTRITRGDRAEPNEVIREALTAILDEFPPL